MSRRKSLSDIGVANLKPRPARYAEPDPELRGHYVRVTPIGAKSFVAVARDPAGKQVGDNRFHRPVLCRRRAREGPGGHRPYPGRSRPLPCPSDQAGHLSKRRRELAEPARPSERAALG